MKFWLFVGFGGRLTTRNAVPSWSYKLLRFALFSATLDPPSLRSKELKEKRIEQSKDFSESAEIQRQKGSKELT